MPSKFLQTRVTTTEKVKYRVDDGAETLVDLYESSRTTPQSVYKAENLTEGEHTLYAVTQKERSGSAVVNQVAYVQVTHSPYIAKRFLNWKIRGFP